MSEVEQPSGLSSFVVLHEAAEAWREWVDLHRLETNCVTTGSE